MTARREAEVLIVGGGPAGSTLAQRLGREGREVLLLERARFPRPKPCGEFISPECLPLLAELGVLDDVRAAGAHVVRGMRLHGYGHDAEGRYGRWAAAAPGAESGLALGRETFDALLAAAARATPGVRIEEGVRASGVLLERGEVRGVRVRDGEGRPREIRARFVVGADGLRSRIARSLGVHRPSARLRRFAVVACYEGVPPQDTGEVHLFPRGYFAATSVEGGLFTLNQVMDAERLARGSAAVDAQLDRAARAHPSLGPRLAGAHRRGALLTTGPLACTTTRQIFDGAALVGDACGYVDPMTGEGIYYALRTAELLCAELLPALRRPGPIRADALAVYPAQRTAELGARLRLARWLARGMSLQPLTRGFVAQLAHRPHLMDLLVERTGGTAPRGLVHGPTAWLRAARS